MFFGKATSLSPGLNACNGSVASAKPHVADLAFAEVFENAVRPIAVRIPVFKSLFACDDNHHRMLRRRYDPSLSLSIEAGVNVEPPIVNAAHLNSPAHHRRQCASQAGGTKNLSQKYLDLLRLGVRLPLGFVLCCGGQPSVLRDSFSVCP